MSPLTQSLPHYKQQDDVLFSRRNSRAAVICCISKTKSNLSSGNKLSFEKYFTAKKKKIKEEQDQEGKKNTRSQLK